MEKLKAEICIQKEGETITRKLYLIFWGAEFTKDFFTKKELKNMIDFLKFHNVPIKILHANYNCSYMNLPF